MSKNSLRSTSFEGLHNVFWRNLLKQLNNKNFNFNNVKIMFHRITIRCWQMMFLHFIKLWIVFKSVFHIIILYNFQKILQDNKKLSYLFLIDTKSSITKFFYASDMSHFNVFLLDNFKRILINCLRCVCLKTVCC